MARARAAARPPCRARLRGRAQCPARVARGLGGLRDHRARADRRPGRPDPRRHAPSCARRQLQRRCRERLLAGLADRRRKAGAHGDVHGARGCARCGRPRVSTIEVQRRGDLAVGRINRPPANAMSPELLADGLAVTDELRADPPAAVVLTGLPGYFSAGLDLKMVPTLDEQGQRGMVDGVNRIFSAWYRLPWPTVAAVTGHAIAGGMILALCCDYRVVGSAGKFGLTEVRVGVGYPTAALTVVQAELSPQAARRLALVADLVDAGTALQSGAFDEQVEDERVEERALEVAAELAKLPGPAYAQTKLTMRAAALAVMDSVLAEGDQAAEGWFR